MFKKVVTFLKIVRFIIKLSLMSYSKGYKYQTMKGIYVDYVA